MTTKITVVYDAPPNPEAFERRFQEELALLAGIPLLQGMEAHRHWPPGFQAPTLAYRFIELFFEDSDAVRGALGTPGLENFISHVLDVGANGAHITLHHDA